MTLFLPTAFAIRPLPGPWLWLRVPRIPRLHRPGLKVRSWLKVAENHGKINWKTELVHQFSGNILNFLEILDFSQSIRFSIQWQAESACFPMRNTSPFGSGKWYHSLCFSRSIDIFPSGRKTFGHGMPWLRTTFPFRMLGCRGRGARNA